MKQQHCQQLAARSSWCQGCQQLQQHLSWQVGAHGSTNGCVYSLQSYQAVVKYYVVGA